MRVRDILVSGLAVAAFATACSKGPAAGGPGGAGGQMPPPVVMRLL